MMISWIDDNAIVRQENNAKDLKQALMNQFECKDSGPMTKYVACMIEKFVSGEIKFRQKVLF